MSNALENDDYKFVQKACFGHHDEKKCKLQHMNYGACGSERECEKVI